MLPADYGDSIWIEYGHPSAPLRILMDCGTLPTFDALEARIAQLPAHQRRFELLIVSHIDTDHIDAAVKLLNSDSLGVQFQEVWFNDWNHLTPPDQLGPIQGDYLAALIKNKNLPLNRSFNGASIAVPTSGPLLTHKLDGGMQLTVLSPGWPQLAALIPVWQKELKGTGLNPGDTETALEQLAKDQKYAADHLGPSRPNIPALAASPFVEDTSPANGSSIAVLAEYEGKSCLFAADAHPTVLAASMDRLLQSSGADKLSLSAYKIPHHGSKHNTSTDLLRKLRCSKFLFSSSGKKFGHPDPETVARVIITAQPKPSLLFNYLSPRNEIWNDQALMKHHAFQASFPPALRPGLFLQL